MSVRKQGRRAELAELTERPNNTLEPTGMNLAASRERCWAGGSA